MQKLIIAHRGASNLAHENTIGAFEKAIELGADYIELDVRKTKDGHLVVYHYGILKGDLLRHCSYKKALELSKKSNFEIPTLAQVLKLTAGKIKLNLELKEGGYEKEVLQLVLKYFKLQDFVITSFRCPVILFVKQNYPEVKTGLIIESLPWTFYNSFRYFDVAYFFDSINHRAQAIADSDFVVLNKEIFASDKINTPAFAAKPFFVYTVDKEKEINHLLKQDKILGLITNKPDSALKIRSQII